MRRENPVLGFIGLLMMMGGVVIVVATYALYLSEPGSTRKVAVGVAMTLIGWLTQRAASGRRAQR